MNYARHSQTTVRVAAQAANVFAFLDDQEALGAHMMKGSAMMAGGRMSYEFDEGRGRAVGSVIRMRGAMMGIQLAVQEVVTERTPPSRKVLETRGKQQMIVIDAYRLGFEVQPIAAGSEVRVFIDYNLPPGPIGLMAALPAHFYARWCVVSMANAAVQHFPADRNHNRREQTNASA